MGFLKIFLEHRQKKIAGLNTLCEYTLGQLSLALSEYSNIFYDKLSYLDPQLKSKYTNTWSQLYADTARLDFKKLKRATGFRELTHLTDQFIHDYDNIGIQLRKHNENVTNAKVSHAKTIICPVEGRNLDKQQLSCIVKNVHNHLVVAGAGTGKTTTIIGLIKYLLNTNQFEAKDLLVLSFTNASATEMSQRICNETGKSLDAMTFHKLGMKIIASVDGVKPRITQINLRSFFEDNIQLHMKNSEYLNLLVSYLMYNRVAEKSEFEFKTQREYEDYLKLNPPITMRSETVKSYAELDIANFLYQNDVKYIYESPYKIDTRTLEHGQYKPDFYLPEYDIYIEHFGISKKGNVPDYFMARNGKSPSETYRESMEWKRNLHKQQGTRLIETYYYEKNDGILLQGLKSKLTVHGVIMNPKSPQQLWNEITTQESTVFEGIVELFETIVNLIKGNNYSIQNVRALNSVESSCRVKNEIILSLIEPLFNEYNSQLQSLSEIDFNDMINIATDLIENGSYHHDYKFVIVDEYQDISKSRFMLLKKMREQSDFKLFCVGDDWQSIYRFAGSDIGFLLNYEKYWGSSEISKIETTYRFSKSLIEISGKFIMQNPMQIKKALLSSNTNEEFSIGEISGYTEKNAIDFMARKLPDLPVSSSVFFIGRYSLDVKLLETCPLFQSQYNNITGVVDASFVKRKDLKITFITAHKSKGLQADYVFLLNNKRNGMGFPSKIQDAPILNLLLDGCDRFPFAEERRLFYVAITRAKQKAWLITQNGNESEFVQEIKREYGHELQKEKFTCPLCGGHLIRRKGPYGEFWGCTNYSQTGCQYKRKL